MTIDMADEPSTPGVANMPRLVLRASALFLVLVILMGAVLFCAAGRLDWGRGWILIGVMFVVGAICLPILLIANPAVVEARLSVHRGAMPFDKVFVALLGSDLLALLVVPGLDAVRFKWSSLPVHTVCAGVALYVLGTIPVTWAMCVNPYLGGTVRIQTERGHRVIATGPYRIIRHPTYAGVIVMFSGWPLILGSLSAFIPAGLMIPIFVFRTAFEDRTLQKDLPGYAEYAKRTRYRLLPFVW